MSDVLEISPSEFSLFKVAYQSDRFSVDDLTYNAKRFLSSEGRTPAAIQQACRRWIESCRSRELIVEVGDDGDVDAGPTRQGRPKKIYKLSENHRSDVGEALQRMALELIGQAAQVIDTSDGVVGDVERSALHKLRVAFRMGEAAESQTRRALLQDPGALARALDHGERMLDEADRLLKSLSSVRLTDPDDLWRARGVAGTALRKLALLRKTVHDVDPRDLGEGLEEQFLQVDTRCRKLRKRAERFYYGIHFMQEWCGPSRPISGEASRLLADLRAIIGNRGCADVTCKSSIRFILPYLPRREDASDLDRIAQWICACASKMVEPFRWRFFLAFLLAYGRTSAAERHDIFSNILDGIKEMAPESFDYCFAYLVNPSEVARNATDADYEDFILELVRGVEFSRIFLEAPFLKPWVNNVLAHHAILKSDKSRGELLRLMGQPDQARGCAIDQVLNTVEAQRPGSFMPDPSTDRTLIRGLVSVYRSIDGALQTPFPLTASSDNTTAVSAGA